MNDKRHYADEVMRELYRRRETSDLCLDCLMEDWVAEIGAERLERRA